MRIISYNVNGIRAAIRKGFLDLLRTDPGDVVCIQETKALETDVDLTEIEKMGYHTYWFSAEKKGYSGVAVFSRIKPLRVKKGNGHPESDFEGRVIELEFEHLKLINAYFPSGTSGDERQQFKYKWLDEFGRYLKKERKTHPRMVLCGDYNIAHEEIDIHDPKGNRHTTGFLPEERAWMTEFLASGWIDTFRHLNKNPHHYTWWSQRFPSVRLQNKGWRIDYITITQPLESQLVNAEILPDVKHSDHCPVLLELKKQS